MTGRYAERAKDALYSYLTDTTTGVAARCVALNTSMADAYTLPTVWVTEKDQRSRHLEKSTIIVFPKRTTINRSDNDRRPTQRLYDVEFDVWFGLGMQNTQGDPGRAQTLVDRLVTVMWECFTDETTFKAETLGDATNVNDCRLQSAEFRFGPPNNRGERSAWAQGQGFVTVVENTAKT